MLASLVKSLAAERAKEPQAPKSSEEVVADEAHGHEAPNGQGEEP
jgi:hypothetical protein